MTGLTPAQLAERRQGITATDVPAILGLHPYRSAIDVWLEKMGEDVPCAGDPDVLEMGLELEAPVRRIYARRQSCVVGVVGTMQHRLVPHHKATPDGLVLRGDTPGGRVLHPPFPHIDLQRGLECKSHSVRFRDEYGEPGTDEVPEHELLQCAWGMHVCELPRWDLALIMDNRMRIYHTERNLELEAMLVDAADRFWRDHVLAKKPPAPDGSRQYTEWLRRRWPGRGPAVQADEQTAAAFVGLRDVRRIERQLADRRARYEQTIQAAMGDAESIEANGERITWKRCKDSERVDWEAVAHELSGVLDLQRTFAALGVDPQRIITALQSVDVSAIITNRTKTTPGARQFRVPRSWHKETE